MWCILSFEVGHWTRPTPAVFQSAPLWSAAASSEVQRNYTPTSRHILEPVAVCMCDSCTRHKQHSRLLLWCVGRRAATPTSFAASVTADNLERSRCRAAVLSARGAGAAAAAANAAAAAPAADAAAPGLRSTTNPRATARGNRYVQLQMFEHAPKPAFWCCWSSNAASHTPHSRTLLQVQRLRRRLPLRQQQQQGQQHRRSSRAEARGGRNGRATPMSPSRTR